MTTAKYKIVVEQHEDGFVAYPLGFAGCVVGQGDSADRAGERGLMGKFPQDAWRAVK
jgi:hypothetical protein